MERPSGGSRNGYTILLEHFEPVRGGIGFRTGDRCKDDQQAGDRKWGDPLPDDR
ncbi:hypothetical protein ACFL3H_06380 [Gemmatimonadota bacterium]